MLADAMTFLPPVIAVRRMQKFGERYILAEDLYGRFYLIDRCDHGPIKQVFYYDYYPSTREH